MILIRNGNRFIRTRDLRVDPRKGDSEPHDPEYDADHERRLLAHQRRIHQDLQRQRRLC